MQVREQSRFLPDVANSHGLNHLALRSTSMGAQNHLCEQADIRVPINFYLVQELQTYTLLGKLAVIYTMVRVYPLKVQKWQVWKSVLRTSTYISANRCQCIQF